jgi:nitrate reductase gamma subunit
MTSAKHETAASPTTEEYSVAFTPRQAAVGFVIIAGLIALLLRRRGAKRAKAARVVGED